MSEVPLYHAWNEGYYPAGCDRPELHLPRGRAEHPHVIPPKLLESNNQNLQTRHQALNIQPWTQKPDP